LEPDPHGAAQVWLKQYEVSAWALVAAAGGQDGVVEETDALVAEIARAYEVPAEAVQAALAYYRRYPLQIDARLAALAADNDGDAGLAAALAPPGKDGR
jgi:hypothetical protein